ncbi:MAG: hypothetical protein JSW38_13625 [Dehalococcoidia bacterium]|nr:MAG: hypothetical protein JSW38_13625 [Dehalococcoidia bacterium]
MGAPVSPLPHSEHIADGTVFPLTTAKCPPIRPGELDLEDYSGPLQRQISPLDFTKDTLVSMNKELGTLYILQDGLWFGRVSEKWGEKVAWERESRLWEVHSKYNAFFHVEALNIQGTPVEKCLKAQQINAGYGSLLYDTEVELVAPNVGIVTNNKCTTVDFFLNRGQDLTIYKICWTIDQPLFLIMAQCFDPGMKCMPLKLIPRIKDDEPYCKWVFWLGDVKTGDPHSYAADMNKAAEAEGTPSDLEDYSGPLHPRLEIGNFCKETVARMLVQSSRLYRLIDGQWRGIVQELYGDDAAWELQEKVWEIALGYNSRNISRALKVEGSPVEKCLKLLQVNPVFGLLYNCTFELESPDVGVVNNYRCTTRDYFERVGGDVNLSRICGDTEQRLLQKFASTIDVGIKVTTRKMPARDRRADPKQLVGLAERISPGDEREPVCQWEFKL